MLDTRDAEFMRSIAGIVKEHVGNVFATLAARVETLEQRESPRGEKGDIGDRGERGEKGDPGQDGQMGPVGPQGEPGEKGEKGDPGERGAEGPEGVAGRDGRDGLPGVPGTAGMAGLDGKDGRNGIDGKDGAGFDDWIVEYDGKRTFTFGCGSGDKVKKFSFVVPFMLDAGVYKASERYERGDAVTYAGSLFIAQEDTDKRPEEPNSGWRLSVKRGRDGKDGKPGERGEKGAEGRPGRDLTQMTFSGAKY